MTQRMAGRKTAESSWSSSKINRLKIIEIGIDVGDVFPYFNYSGTSAGCISIIM
jgi:hypothetical protein